MEAGNDDEIIEILKSDLKKGFESGVLVGAIIGLTVMFLIYNIL